MEDIRKYYGEFLAQIATTNEKIIALDAEVSNSTGSYKFKEVNIDHFIECFIAEQNMIEVAMGLSGSGYIPFVSTFGAFLTRCYDQIRMCHYSNLKLNVVGSHCGIAIGMDGASQMALEDISMFNSIQSSKIYYPSDKFALKAVINMMANDQTTSINYCRLTRGDLEDIYSEDSFFVQGGSSLVYKNYDNTHRKADMCLISAGLTLIECINAAKLLKDYVKICVIDLYCVKPINYSILNSNMEHATTAIVVEDHYPNGGIHSIICQLFQKNRNINKVLSIAVENMPKSGSKEELYCANGLDAISIKNFIEKELNSQFANENS